MPGLTQNRWRKAAREGGGDAGSTGVGFTNLAVVAALRGDTSVPGGWIPRLRTLRDRSPGAPLLLSRCTNRQVGRIDETVTVASEQRREQAEPVLDKLVTRGDGKLRQHGYHSLGIALVGSSRLLLQSGCCSEKSCFLSNNMGGDVGTDDAVAAIGVVGDQVEHPPRRLEAEVQRIAWYSCGNACLRNLPVPSLRTRKSMQAHAESTRKSTHTDNWPGSQGQNRPDDHAAKGG